MIEETDPKLWISYFRTHLLRHWSPVLSRYRTDSRWDFFLIFRLPQFLLRTACEDRKSHHRNEICSSAMVTCFRATRGLTSYCMASGKSVLAKSGLPIAAELMNFLITQKNLNAASALLNNVQQTRAAALSKAEKIRHHVGGPKWLFHTNFSVHEDTYFNNSLYSSRDMLLRTVWKLLALYVSSLASRGQRGVEVAWYALGIADKILIRLPATSVNAAYVKFSNSVFVPAAVLQPPFYDGGYNPAVVYGGLGSVLGHEITHGFDINGANYDENANRRNWWTEKVKELFINKTECLRKLYANLEIAGPAAIVDH
eukprot:766883-Hanusia_phi.AAC.3